MRSDARSEALDLERGLPTTGEDSEALRRARTVRTLDLAEYLHFLDQLPRRSLADLRRKRGPRGDRPFVIA